jgi:hypothetical protein
MFITGHDFDDDGVNDLYIVHRPMTEAERGALATLIVWVVASVLILAALAWVGMAVLDATNWVANKLSRWTCWDWLLWITLPVVSITTFLVFVKTYRLGLTCIAILVTSFPSALLAAIWAWSATTWIIFAAVMLGFLTIGVGGYFIWRDRQFLLEEAATSVPVQPYIKLCCPHCTKRMSISTALMGKALRCLACHALMRIDSTRRVR